MILANTTSSGLETRWWIEQLLQVCENEGRRSGGAFNNADGSLPSPSEYNALVRHYFAIIQSEENSVMDQDTPMIRYGISRTYRKSSESRALKAGVPKDQVEVMNRWKKIERAKGRKPHFAMADHYADARELSTLTWRYSYAL